MMKSLMKSNLSGLALSVSAFFTLAVSSTVPHAAHASEFDERWNAYVKDSGGRALQADCQPRRLSPRAGVPARGAIILFHGFTACPQQFFEWSRQLTEAGFEVILPVLPGHGFPTPATGPLSKKTDYSQMPDLDHWKDYAAFTDRMIGLMQAYPGSKQIGGFSLGGAVALLASARAPQLFERMILFSPFFQASGFLVRNFVLPLATTFHPNMEGGWGKDCYDGIQVGRAGVCDFQAKQVGAIQKFGRYVAKQAKPFGFPVQVVGVENDSAADDGITVEVLSALKSGPIAGNAQVTACFAPSDVNHSILSRVDSVHPDHYWVKPITAQATRYVVEGIPFDTTGESAQKPYGLCRVR